MLTFSSLLLITAATAFPTFPVESRPPLAISVRNRVETTQTRTVTKPDGTLFTEAVKVPVERTITRTVVPSASAIIICDMWDKHWCPSATSRCDVLAKKAAGMIATARSQGMTIIHCPSDCMAFYKEHPARLRTRELKTVAPPKSHNLPDPPLPIDDSDGGCDDVPQPASRRAWTQQHPAIRIDDERDFITDTGSDVYNILKAKSITTVFVMGVHTNMCVLHRSFGIKQLRRWDVDCILIRDLTDTMYNPKMRPFVSHDEGTQLVIGYIEQHWCPSTTSEQIRGTK